MPVTALRVEWSYNSRGVGGRRSWLSSPRRLPGQLLGPLPPPYYQGGRGTRASPVWRIFTVTWTLRAVANFGEHHFHVLRRIRAGASKARTPAHLADTHYKSLLSFRGLLHDAQLLQQAQGVEFAPVFDDLPLGDAKPHHPREADLSAGRSDAEELAGVPTEKPHPGYPLVAFAH